MDKKAQWGLVSAAWFLALSVTGLGYLALKKLDAPVVAEQGVSEGSVVTEAICPVTKRRLQLQPNTPKLNYKGRDFYFADDVDEKGHTAKQRFLMDPELFLTGISTTTIDEATPVPTRAPTPPDPAPTASK